MRASHTLRRLVLLCLVLFPLSIVAVGCSSEGTVSGKVSYKGQPLKGGTIIFFPEKGTGNYQSVIGADGTYSVSKLPIGPAKISVAVATSGVNPAVFQQRRGGVAKGPEKGLKSRMTDEAKKELETEIKENAPKRGGGPYTGYSSPLPEKYANPDSSGLTIEVTGGKQKHDINMD